MKQTLYSIFLQALSLSLVTAQTTPTPIDYEARVKSVATIKEHIAESLDRTILPVQQPDGPSYAENDAHNTHPHGGYASLIWYTTTK